MRAPSASRTARPSATRVAAARSELGRRVGPVGPPAGRRPLRRRHRSAQAEHVEQPDRPWRNGPLEPALAPTDRVRAHGRIGLGTAGERPRTPGATGQRSQRRRPLGTHRGAEVEHRLVPGPALALGHERVGERLGLLRPRATGRRSGRGRGRRWCRRRPTSCSKAKASTARAVYGPTPGRASRSARSSGSGRRGRRPRPPRSGAGSPPARCSRGPAHSASTSPTGARHTPRASGTARGTRCHRGTTRATWVCCSITSLTRTAHGSRVPPPRQVAQRRPPPRRAARAPARVATETRRLVGPDVVPS